MHKHILCYSIYLYIISFFFINVNLFFLHAHCIVFQLRRRRTTYCLSSMSLLMSVEFNSGAADGTAAVTWPGVEVAARFDPRLTDCSFLFHSCVSRFFKHMYGFCVPTLVVWINFFVNFTLCFLDFFGNECTEDSAEECSDFRYKVPMSKQFNSTAFDQYCR